MIEPRTLRKTLPKDVRTLCRTLRDKGYRAWVVGGCVRDTLLDDLAGSDSVGARNDWDLATDARPEQVQALFRRVIPTGVEHGTVTVMMGTMGYEVTTLRAEAGYADGRRPDTVNFVDDIVADLARRDFTINAIAYDPELDELLDPFDGISDLKGRCLRAVGVASERFTEDGLRELRAARFVATLDVELEPATAAAIQPSLASYRKVSAERIRDEWMKAMKARVPSRAFCTMLEHGLLEITAPELIESVGCEQNRYHAYDVWGHAMACLDASCESPQLRIAALLHDVGKPRSREKHEVTGEYTFYNHESIGAKMAEPILRRLKFSNDDRQRIVSLVRHHLLCYDETWSDAAVRRWLRRVSPELAEDLYLLGTADALGKGLDATSSLDKIVALKAHVRRVVEAGAALSVRDLAISGTDLMSELGLRPGPILGTILRTLLDEVTEEPAHNQREHLLKRAVELADAAPDP